MEDPIEVLLPSGDGLLVILCIEKSRDQISAALFPDLPLYLGNSPVIEIFVSRSPGMRAAG